MVKSIFVDSINLFYSLTYFIQAVYNWINEDDRIQVADP